MKKKLNKPLILIDAYSNMEDSPYVFAYERALREERLLIFLNFSKESQMVEIPEAYLDEKTTVMISNYKEDTVRETGTLRPYEATVLYRNQL